MNSIHSIEDLEAFIAGSHEQPAVLFKHSTRCPISAQAAEEMKQVTAQFEGKNIAFGLVLVVEDREVSLAAQDKLGVKHESPQVMLLKDGSVIWHDSHHQIRCDRLESILSPVS
ncbi:bacillithiol system redox-active protein YtxJ [Paenibacillus aquistagni]|uniref:bacillithiol system redox-active protein YtxJ n=1 Tax=Paenibacillus aquistagni TaxID=1852522 RepID=UPI000B50E66F|nr:bacillithiol system redox-active protein YtxJ [Paenibacillus aquistagni]